MADEAGLAYVDITTGEFATTQTSLNRAISELERLKPSEIIAAKSADLTSLNIAAPVTRLEDYDFDLESTTKTIAGPFRRGLRWMVLAAAIYRWLLEPPAHHPVYPRDSKRVFKPA